MSPRIAYWTSSFEWHMEAVASEVALLRRHFPASVAWGLSRRHWALLRPRQLCLHPRLHLVFRAFTRVFEPAFQLNHIFGNLGDWYYLRGVRRRPTVLTVATWAEPVAPALLEHVDQFVVEHPEGRAFVEQLGVSPDRCRLILPPVDLERFQPATLPPDVFTILFASSPESVEGLHDRGVPALLDAAALRPDWRFRLLWRPWGNSEPRVRAWIAERGLRNVELVAGRHADMAAHYRAAHVTVAPFATLATTKPAPNSVIESLACGRPVVVSETVGLAGLIREAGAGGVCPVVGSALAEELDRLRQDWDAYSRRARRLAERRFSARQFVEQYARLYAEVLSPGRTTAPVPAIAG